MRDYRKLGQILLDRGKITSEQLDVVIQGGPNRGRRIGDALVAMGFATEWDVAECLAEQFGFDMVDPGKITPEQRALSLLTADVALSHKVLLHRSSQDMIECVMSDPIDFPTSDMISQICGRRTFIRIAPVSALVAAIRRAYGLKDGPEHARPARRSRRRAPRLPKDREAILAQLDASERASDEAVYVRL